MIVRFITIVMVLNLLRLIIYVHKKYEIDLFACYKSKLKMLLNSSPARHTLKKIPGQYSRTPPPT